MKEIIRKRLQHAVLALLLSAGLVIPLCGALDGTMVFPRLILLIAGMILLFELASLNRISSWTAALLFLAAAAVWFFRGNGARMLSDAAVAAGLRMKGVKTAIPLIAQPFSVLIAVIMTLLCCFSALQDVSCIPSLMLCTVVIMIIWLTDSMNLIPWLLPALAAALTLLMTGRYEDTHPIRILPWTAGLVAVAYLLSGFGPAENSLKEKADEIRQSVLDRLFFTEARDIFSLYAAGFSPQGMEQLGGKPNPSEKPVMQVSSPKTVYLRGTVYNRYTGHGWLNTTGGRRYLWQSRMMEDTRSAIFDEKLPPESIQNSLSKPEQISVRMLSGSASTLFVPQRVRDLNPGGETVPYFSNSSEIFITRNLQEGDTWEVSAPLYFCTDSGIGTLTDLCAMYEDPQWDPIASTYTELPSHLEKPVKELADEIVYKADTPYEKAMALQNYLIRNYQYTLDVEEHPVNIDFVTSFLLDTRKGYCTYFASAMTVLCRMEGLPSRYVEGYLAEPDADGAALVTGMNAHAWTEVYFRGFGWLTFDATPGRNASGRQQKAPDATPAPSPEPPQNQDEKTTEPSNEPQNPTDPAPDEMPTETPPEQEPEGKTTEANESAFPWWLLVLAIAAGTGLRFRMTSPSFREKRAETEEKRFDIWANEITALLRAEHLERRNGETPMTFARRMDETGLFSESLTPAGECLSTIRYSRKIPQEQDTGLMRDTAMLLRTEVSKGAKIRYLARRLLSNNRIKRIIKSRKTNM